MLGLFDLAGSVAFVSATAFTTVAFDFGVGFFIIEDLFKSRPIILNFFAKEIIDDMKFTGRGFILQPSCDLPMNAKSINLYAMLKACRDFGNYTY